MTPEQRAQLRAPPEGGEGGIDGQISAQFNTVPGREGVPLTHAVLDGGQGSLILALQCQEHALVEIQVRRASAVLQSPTQPVFGSVKVTHAP